RNLVTLGLQLFDRAHQLTHRGTDVGQLDDVGIRLQRELAQFSQVVGHFLRVGQIVWEFTQDTRRHRNVAGDHVDISLGRKAANQWQKRRRGQHGRFVGQGVNDLCFVFTHVGAPVSFYSRNAGYQVTV